MQNELVGTYVVCYQRHFNVYKIFHEENPLNILFDSFFQKKNLYRILLAIIIIKQI